MAKWRLQLLLFQSDPVRTARCGGEWWRINRTTATLMFMFWAMWMESCIRKVPFWNYASGYGYGTFCCMLRQAAWSLSFCPHAVWNIFNPFYLLLLYHVRLCLVGTPSYSTHYLRHSVTSGWCMFFIIYVYLYSKGVKGDKLIYFYGLILNCILGVWPEWHFIQVWWDGTFFHCSLLMFSVWYPAWGK